MTLVYNGQVYDQEMIDRLATYYVNAFTTLLDHLDDPHDARSLLSEAEQQHLLYELNDTISEYPREFCLHELFEAEAESQPNAVALIHNDTRLTFRELNKHANQLAHYLRERGVGPDTLVGLCVERSPAMVVGILGILKAGGAYVPLDPSYPQEQLAYLIKDSAPALVLTESTVKSDLPTANKLHLDAAREFLSAYPSHNPEPKSVGLTSKNLAYVIYTSGSTGRPKGVMIEHASVVNLALNLLQQVGHSTEAAWGWLASYAFDASVKGLAQLMTGRPLFIVSENEKDDPRALASLLERQSLGVLDCTPSLLELWLSMGLEANLPDLVIGGEAISAALWQQLVQWQQQYGRRAFNVYGPTECTVDTTGTLIEGDTPHIGRPWGNVRCYVLGDDRNLVPKGSAGELFVGGDGLARGYLNQPELTDERFTNVRIAGDEVRLYKTGDLVRYLADGNLEFVGRSDDQVKLRGFRIELGEVQNQLAQLPDVAAATVIMREDEPGDRRLVAYVTLDKKDYDEGEVIAALRRDLQLRVPDYMVPAAFVVLDEFPLTANGKLDRRALPIPGFASLRAEYVAPATETEIALAQMWARLLKLDADAISADANLFELGGHSLLLIRLITEIRNTFAVELTIREVMDHPQLHVLSQRILETRLKQALTAGPEYEIGADEMEITI